MIYSRASPKKQGIKIKDQP